MEKPPQTIRAELTEALEELATIALAKPGESPTATCPTETWVQRLCELDALEALDALLDRWYQVNSNVPQVIVRVTSNLIDQLQAASSPVLRKALLRSSLAIRLRPEMWSAIQSVREVFHRLEMAAQNLIDQGAIDHQSIPGSSPANLSGAMVLASALDSRTIMAIQQEAGLSKAEWAVIDGIHQRTALVETPVAQLLRWWGAIAPDDVRAMLNQLWREPTSIVEDPEIYEWALELVRNWLGTAPGEPEQFVLDAAATPDRAVRSEWVHAIGELGGLPGSPSSSGSQPIDNCVWRIPFWSRLQRRACCGSSSPSAGPWRARPSRTGGSGFDSPGCSIHGPGHGPTSHAPSWAISSPASLVRYSI